MPSRIEAPISRNRRILSDQMDFLFRTSAKAFKVERKAENINWEKDKLGKSLKEFKEIKVERLCQSSGAGYICLQKRA